MIVKPILAERIYKKKTKLKPILIDFAMAVIREMRKTTATWIVTGKQGI